MSNQKRELQRIKREKAIRKAKAKKGLAGLAIGLAVVALAAVIGYVIYYKTVLTTQPIENYSEGLADDGTISGVAAKDYVTIGDLAEMEVNYSDYAPDKEIIDTKITNVLQANEEYSTEPGAVVELYDTINLDYVGSVDGVEFEGGSTAGGGTVITVGDAGYIEGFEDQLIGHKIGESFDINVTFPEDYGTEELAGKDAVFAITLNGIYYTPEFNDAFVKENLSDIALTADAYRAYLEEQEVNAALETYVQEYSLEVCQVKNYPEAYVEDVMGIVKYADTQEYESWSQYYEAMGLAMDTSFYEYKETEGEMEYEAALRIRAEEIVESNLIIQAIYEDAGLTVTSDHLDTVMEEMGASSEYLTQMEETYGSGYIYQRAMKVAVVEYLMDNVKVIK